MRLSLITAALLWAAQPALADQHLDVADNGTANCLASNQELSRLSLIGDDVASVQKMGGVLAIRDFAIAHEPITGDIYLSVPDYFEAKSLSFFITSKRGYTYKVVCRVARTGAQQIFLTNAEITASKAQAHEASASAEDVATGLIKAMYNRQTVEGYRIRQPVAFGRSVGDLRVRLVAEYEGAGLIGKVIHVTNKGKTPAAVNAGRFATSNTIAQSAMAERLAPSEATEIYLVSRRGD